MISIVKAEVQKTRHSMQRSFLVLFPLVTLSLAALLTLGMVNSYAESVWNWWDLLLLPGMIAILCNLSVSQEKKTGFYHLQLLPTGKKRLMLGKIIYLSIAIFASNVMIFAGSTCGGRLLTTHVPVKGTAMAVIVLTIAKLWSVPVCLFLCDKFGLIVELCVYLALSVAGGLIAQTDNWYLLVSAVSSRMLCPLIYVQPNGLPVEAGSILLDTGVLLPGISISALWFVILSVMFLHYFEKREA